MARSKKRAAPTAASTRPAKKRASAAASLAKMKVIADAEEQFSEDEREEAKPLVAVSNASDEDAQSEVDIEGMQDHEIIAQGALPVVAPGFRLWETDSRLASKGELTQISKYDTEKEKYTQILKVMHDESFRLVPLMVTQGPYKGSHVFMLQPQTGFFRFMDFPAEIRTMVYACLFESDGPIRVITRKRVNQPRRPVPSSTTFARRKGTVTIRENDIFLPVGLHLLQVSKQILREAAAVLYGNNKFTLHDLADMKVLLDKIGSMRPYLRNLQVASNGYWRSKARSTFALLKDATELRTLSFHHTDVCGDNTAGWLARFYTTPERLAGMLTYAFQGLKTAHKTKESPVSVLDLIKIDWKRCEKCKKREPEFADDCSAPGDHPYIYARTDGCKVKCKDAAEHCKEVELKIRKSLASILNIKDDVTASIEARRETSPEL